MQYDIISSSQENFEKNNEGGVHSRNDKSYSKTSLKKKSSTVPKKTK